MHYHVSCERHILTSFLIPDLLLFSAFIYGLYIFRWGQTEQLTTLTEAVRFLQYGGRPPHPPNMLITLQSPTIVNGVQGVWLACPSPHLVAKVLPHARLI